MNCFLGRANPSGLFRVLSGANSMVQITGAGYLARLVERMTQRLHESIL